MSSEEPGISTWDLFEIPVKDAAPPKLQRPSLSRISSITTVQETPTSSATTLNIDSALRNKLSKIRPFLPELPKSVWLTGQKALSPREHATTRKKKGLSVHPITESTETNSFIESTTATTPLVISHSEASDNKSKDAKLTTSSFPLLPPSSFSLAPPAASPTPTSLKQTEVKETNAVRITTVVEFKTVTTGGEQTSASESEHIQNQTARPKLTSISSSSSEELTLSPSLAETTTSSKSPESPIESETSTWTTVTIPKPVSLVTELETSSKSPTTTPNTVQTTIQTPVVSPSAPPASVITPTLPSAPLYVPPSLTSGQIIGIAMGSIFAVLILIAISLLSRRLVLRKKRAKQEALCSPAEPPTEPQPPTSRFSETPTPPPLYQCVTKLGRRTSKTVHSMITSLHRQTPDSEAVPKIHPASSEASWVAGASFEFTRQGAPEMSQLGSLERLITRDNSSASFDDSLDSCNGRKELEGEGSSRL